MFHSFFLNSYHLGAISSVLFFVLNALIYSSYYCTFGFYILTGDSVRRKRNENIEAGVGRMVSYLNREKKLDSFVGRRPVAPVAPKGLYLYGNVGSGTFPILNMFLTSLYISFSIFQRNFSSVQCFPSFSLHLISFSSWKGRSETFLLFSSLLDAYNPLS